MFCNVILSNGVYDPLECILPGIHLDHPDASDHLVHDTNTSVSLPSRLEVIVIAQPGGLYLIYKHAARGRLRPRASAYKSGAARLGVNEHLIYCC